MSMISATLVRDLREKTGVGMMECKKALEENQGDVEKAIVWLRERGMSRAARKADRVASEGIVQVLVSPDQKSGVLVEVNCETDFVSRNPDFLSFAHSVAEIALKGQVKDVEALGEAHLEKAGTKVSEQLATLISTIGENMKLRRLERVSVINGVVEGYSHMGGKIGTLVALEGGQDAKAQEVAKDLAMHVAAAAPKYLDSSKVDAAEIEQERGIARKKLLEEGKPENLIEKILEGQIKKLFKEVCLVEQAFVKDPNVTVTKYVQSAGAQLKVAGFVRFALGEGIEKKTENFADEVAAQLRK